MVLPHDFFDTVRQRLFRRLRLGLCTVDAEYDAIEARYARVHKNVFELHAHLATWITSVRALLSVMEVVGDGAMRVFDPYTSLPKHICADSGLALSASAKSTFSKEYRAWDNASCFKRATQAIGQATAGELDHLHRELESYMATLTKVVEPVAKHMRHRLAALFEYDRVYNAHEALSLKQNSYGLSAKEDHQLFNLERKLDATKNAYDTANNMLKHQLPQLTALVAEFLQPLVYIAYYVQLTVSYHFVVNLKMDHIPDLWEAVTLASFVQELTQEHERRLAPQRTVMDRVFGAPGSYCVAMYAFEAEQKGDLSFAKGDRIKILDNRESWWRGEVAGQVGLFPPNYVEVVGAL